MHIAHAHFRKCSFEPSQIEERSKPQLLASPVGDITPELSGTERLPAPSPYPQTHPAAMTSLFAVPTHSHVLQKCLLQGQRTPVKARKLLSDSHQLAGAEVHSLQTWEAQIEKKHTFPDVCKPCTGVFWPVTSGPNRSYISHVEHIFYHKPALFWEEQAF